MVIDTSALVAILLNEPEAPRFRDAVEQSARRLISAVTQVELACVIEGRAGAAGRLAVERLLAAMDAEIVAATPAQAEVAITAFRRYGRGQHRARFNLGDCFSYALAKSSSMALLFKGDDFIHTDVAAAI